MDTRRVKGAGGVAGGRSDLQGGEEGFYFPPDPSVPQHQSPLTPLPLVTLAEVSSIKKTTELTGKGNGLGRNGD